MNAGEWVAIAGLAVTVVGWFIRLERRLGAHLTREEHERICSEQNARVEKSIDDMCEDMDERHAENRETLGEIRDATNGIHQRIDSMYRDILNRGGGR